MLLAIDPSSLEISIRRAMAGDAAAISDLCFRSKQSNGYTDEFMESCRDELTYTEDDLLRLTFWVADIDRIVGSVGLGQGDDEHSGEIHCYFTDPEFQRRGIGKKLWQNMLTEAANKSYRRLHLDSDPFAVPFYNSLGFVIVDQTPSGSIPGRMIPKMEILLEEK